MRKAVRIIVHEREHVGCVTVAPCRSVVRRKVVLNVESVDAEEIESGQEIPNKRLVVRNNDDVT